MVHNKYNCICLRAQMCGIFVARFHSFEELKAASVGKLSIFLRAMPLASKFILQYNADLSTRLHKICIRSILIVSCGSAAKSYLDARSVVHTICAKYLMVEPDLASISVRFC